MVSRPIRLEAASLEMPLFDLLEELIFYKDAEELLLVVEQVTLDRGGCTHPDRRGPGRTHRSAQAPADRRCQGGDHALFQGGRDSGGLVRHGRAGHLSFPVI